ncbi:Gfo/Idh/MocA family protein [Thermoplasma sp.]|uniref:Gfo/Idh/MocA family protein n=1 Tax=Thermoplasma sp. TaxID=1973142 RepID=UPI00127FA4D6|nr:Gfo/Idh/MocA family oxidoreductase [Thermoplasma sp.]KAA8922832.1 MAG: Gfo/Idh/MocA family oxidoreductase [Thermoplasma sp.]
MKVNIIGLNGFGKRHIEAWSKLDVDIEITERKADVVSDLRAKYDIVKVNGSLEEAFRSDAEIFDLVLPHNMHRDVTVKSLSLGKHVLVEKPIATEIADAREMIRSATEHGRKFMVADQYYFDPSVWKAKDIIESGKIGTMHTVIIRDQRKYNWHGWRSQASVMGGGPLIDGGIHFIDTLLNLGGAYSSVRSNFYRSVASIEEPDTVEAIFKFSNGSNGLFFYSWGYPNPPDLPSFEIVGTDGSIIEDLRSKPKNFEAPKGKRAYGDPILNGDPMDLGYHDIFLDEVSGFLRSIVDNTPVPFDPERALRDLVAVKDIYANSI